MGDLDIGGDNENEHNLEENPDEMELDEELAREAEDPEHHQEEHGDQGAQSRQETDTVRNFT